MIILDTNVVSEVMRTGPPELIMTWLNSLEKDDVFLTSITYGELLIGVRLLPSGKRRTQLETLFTTVVDVPFADRILPYDRMAAAQFPGIVTLRRRLGRPTSIQDAQIAAIALAHGASLATRNVRDFEGIGITVINPWDASQTT